MLSDQAFKVWDRIKINANRVRCWFVGEDFPITDISRWEESPNGGFMQCSGHCPKCGQPAVRFGESQSSPGGDFATDLAGHRLE